MTYDDMRNELADYFIGKRGFENVSFLWSKRTDNQIYAMYIKYQQGELYPQVTSIRKIAAGSNLYKFERPKTTAEIITDLKKEELEDRIFEDTAYLTPEERRMMDSDYEDPPMRIY